jgi:hypothetical protein
LIRLTELFTITMGAKAHSRYLSSYVCDIINYHTADIVFTDV